MGEGWMNDIVETAPKLRLEPVYEVRQFHLIWPQIREGCEEILDHTMPGEASLQGIFNDIIGGHMGLFLAYLGDEYVGFCTVRVENVMDGKRYFSLRHAFLKKGVPRGTFLQGLEIVEEIAKKSGCNMLRMWTIRDEGFVKVLTPCGWKRNMVEFVKEI